MGLAFLISSEHLQILSERKVLKEREYTALVDAEALLGAAQADRKRHEAEAKRQYAEQRQLGYDDGFQAGRTEAAQSTYATVLQAAAMLQATRGKMAELVVRAVSEIVADADPRAIMLSAAKRIAQYLQDETYLHIRVHPGRVHMMQEILAGLPGDHLERRTIRVTGDPALRYGDCSVQTPSGTIDAGVDSQLAALRKALTGDGQ
jgi:type III secretion protein L